MAKKRPLKKAAKKTVKKRAKNLGVDESPLDQWEREFRASASADGCAVFREHLSRLGLRDDPQAMLEGTILLVRRCSAYYTLDNRDDQFAGLLEMQTYDPAEAANACYMFTFDICGKAFARVLLETKEGVLDLADLYGSPWHEYRVVGFDHLWVSHPDWSVLTNDETELLEDVITEDLRFDYPEDELDFWFDDSLSDEYLYVTVRTKDMAKNTRKKSPAKVKSAAPTPATKPSSDSSSTGPAIQPRLQENDKTNFHILMRAAKNGDLGLVSAIRRSDHATVALVCVPVVADNGDTGHMPIAVMVEGNPYDQFDPW